MFDFLLNSIDYGWAGDYNILDDIVGVFCNMIRKSVIAATLAWDGAFAQVFDVDWFCLPQLFVFVCKSLSCISSFGVAATLRVLRDP